MAQRLSKADTNFKGYTDSQLLYTALSIHNKLVAAVGNFPTPPVPMAQFLTDINGFQSASATAIKGSKADTANKIAAKKFVILDLQQLAYYVTQVAQASYFVNKDITTVDTLITSSGFKISKTPGITNARTGIAVPILKKVLSKDPGSISFIFRNYVAGKRGKKVYQIQYRTSEIPAVPPATTPTPAGAWKTYVLTQSNKAVLSGLTSGIQYDIQVAVIGGKDTKLNSTNPVNYSNIQTVTVV